MNALASMTCPAPSSPLSGGRAGVTPRAITDTKGGPTASGTPTGPSKGTPAAPLTTPPHLQGLSASTPRTEPGSGIRPQPLRILTASTQAHALNAPLASSAIAEPASLRREMGLLKEKVAKLEAELDKSVNQRGEAQREAENLKTALNKAVVEREAALRDAQQLRATLSEAATQREVERLQAELSEAEAQREEARCEAKQLRTTLNEAVLREKAAQREAAQFRTALSEAAAKQKTALNEAVEQRESAQRDAGQLKSALSDAVTQREAARCEVEQLRTALSRAMLRETAAQCEVERLQVELSEAVAQHKATAQREAAAQREVERLQAALSEAAPREAERRVRVEEAVHVAALKLGRTYDPNEGRMPETVAKRWEEFVQARQRAAVVAASLVVLLSWMPRSACPLLHARLPFVAIRMASIFFAPTGTPPHS